MKSKVLLIIILLAIVSCKQNTQKAQYNKEGMATSTNYKSSKLIDSLANIFLDSSNCQDCINEIYINKVYEGEFYFTFQARKYYIGYFEKNNPLFYFINKNRKVFVYTGVEKLIFGNQKNIDSIEFINKNSNFFLCVNFHLINDSIRMLKVAGHPFMPEFDQFVPDGSEPKFDPKKNYFK